MEVTHTVDFLFIGAFVLGLLLGLILGKQTK